MKITAIIAEYNPFHNGHAHMINKLRQGGTTHVVAVMGGNFSQRGKPAAFNKYARAKAAVAAGADLVIELPVAYSVASAERFALGGVHLAGALGCVDELAFGAETQSLTKLEAIADCLESAGFYENIKQKLKSGQTFAKAREQQVAVLLGEEYGNILKEPNNILAVEYLKALQSLKSGLRPVVVKREFAQHGSGEVITNGFASATAIRKMLEENNPNFNLYVPKASAQILEEEIKQGYVYSAPKAEHAALAVLKRLTKEEIAALPDISEGIENRIFAAICEEHTIAQIEQRIKTKRYTLSRIRRILLCAYLGITERDTAVLPPYIKILAFNPSGQEVLALARNTAKLPVGETLKKLELQNEVCAKFAILEHRAHRLYSLCMENTSGYENEYGRPAVRVL